MSEMTEIKSSDQLRIEAQQHRQSAADSWERSDTDGFLSQWASGISASLCTAQADLVDAGGVHEFAALFDIDGNLVAAKRVQTRYGSAWGLLESDDPHSTFVGWFNPSRAADPTKRLATDRRKGYTVGTVTATAKADIAASGTGLSGCATAHVVIARTDGGFSRDVEIVTTVDTEWHYGS